MWSWMVKSYMQNKKSGQRTKIEYEGGQHVMYIWVPSTMETVKESSKTLKGNSFGILATEGEESGFTRQVKKP